MQRIARTLLTGLVMGVLLPALAVAADDTFVLPAGSTLHVRLTTTLSSRATQNGDPWTGRVEEPIFSGGEQVIPAGSAVDGRVTFVKEPGRVKSPGEMRLIAETMTTPTGEKFQIVASLQDAQGAEGVKVTGDEGTVKGPGKSKKEAAKDAGIGAGVGAAGGVLLGGGTGALYGAGIGAVAAVVRGVLKRGKDVVLPQGTELTFVLSRDTTAKRVIPGASQASSPPLN